MKPLILFLLVAPIIPAQLHASALEDAYLDKRNEYIEKFKSVEGEVDKDDRVALKEGEDQLRQILKPISIDGYPHISNNLVTLQQDMGFGKLDGLAFSNGANTIVVTSKNLLAAYAKSENFPETLDALAKRGDFYFKAVGNDAALTPIAQLPVEVPRGFSFAQAWLALEAQDEGPFVPKLIVGLGQRGDQVFVLRLKASPTPTKIGVCSSAYLTSKASKNRFENYKTCYAEKLAKSPAFTALSKSAQAGFDRLNKP